MRLSHQHQSYRPKCPVCGESIYHDQTPHGAAPMDDLKACYRCTQHALEFYFKEKGIEIPKEKTT